jgi:putative tricarboxylic transport membrane protein
MPSRAVEIVVPSSPGGAQDRTARALQGIMQGAKLVAQPLALTHRPGAGHSLAAAVLDQHPKDGHFLTSSLLTTHILGVNRHNYTDFTPLALLSSEFVGFAVAADGPIRSAGDLVQRLKANPEGVAFAFGTSRGNVNHIGIGQMMRAAGLDPSRAKIVVYYQQALNALGLLREKGKAE